MFMKGATNSSFCDEFDLSTGMKGDHQEGSDLLDIVKGKINNFLADVGSDGTQEELHDQHRMAVLWVK